MDKIETLNEKFTILARHHIELRDSVAMLTKTVNSHSEIIAQMNHTHQMTSELLDLFLAAKGGFKVIGWAGALVKWIWPIAAFGIAIWVFIKTNAWKYTP